MTTTTTTKTIIKPGTVGFGIGKICTCLHAGENVFFLFDPSGKEIVQLSSSFEILNRIPLIGILPVKTIDLVMAGDFGLIIADSLAKTLFRLELVWTPEGKASIKGAHSFPLNAGSIFAAGAVTRQGIVFLDKGSCMLRIYGENFDRLKTIGSRMGYIDEYDEELSRRVGFEFPEDMALVGDDIVISDSGNKRLVVLNKEYELKATFALPRFPYKIAAWKDDLLWVSDFDNSVMAVSLRYGFIHTEPIEYPIDFFLSVFPGKNPGSPLPYFPAAYVGSENSEIIELSFNNEGVETIAQKSGNQEVMMKVCVDSGRYNEARQVVEANGHLLFSYAAYFTDDDGSINSKLENAAVLAFKKSYAENEGLNAQIKKSSLDFIVKYKSIPGCDDAETANIDKENIRHGLFLIIKQYRKNLKTVADCKKSIKNYAGPAQALKKLLDERFDAVKNGILKQIRDIDDHLRVMDELKLLDAAVDYWLLTEEVEMVFKDRVLDYARLFAGKFLLAILNDFYFYIAELFFLRNDIDRYIAFCDREITMYSDKAHVFTQFCNRLIGLNKTGDVLRMLKKFPDQNRENVNFYYYRVFKSRGDMDRAFAHLKKEVDLYSHRVDLIPALIELNKMTQEETRGYIDRILDKSAHAIDMYLNAANSFKNIGEYDKAESYTDQELELFPENKTAMLLKMELVLRRQGQIMDESYYRKAWDIFKRFALINKDEPLALKLMPLFSVLNRVSPTLKDIPEWTGLRHKFIFDPYKKELLIYLSFLKYFKDTVIEEGLEKYTEAEYFSAYSTALSVYDYHFEEMKRLKDLQQWDKVFELASRVSVYFPGDEKLIRFLEGIAH